MQSVDLSCSWSGISKGIGATSIEVEIFIEVWKYVKEMGFV